MNARRVFVCLAAVAVIVLPGFVYGQTSQSALAGVVKDATGAVLPGVTVEAASPALIERVRSSPRTPPGFIESSICGPASTRSRSHCPAFNTVKVENFDLRADFTATVNADLKVGELNETVTVTGEAPLVDVQSTTKSAVYNKEVIENLPNNRRFRASRRRFQVSSADRTSTAPRRAACRYTAAASPKPTAPSTACRSPRRRRRSGGHLLHERRECPGSQRPH
jgi:hypothetical protein